MSELQEWIVRTIDTTTTDYFVEASSADDARARYFDHSHREESDVSEPTIVLVEPSGGEK